MRKSLFPPTILSIALLSLVGAAQAQWVAYNDRIAGGNTSPNATLYDVFGTATNQGPLKNITNGAVVPAILTMARTEGVQEAGSMSVFAVGTPANLLFTNYVDFFTSGAQNALYSGISQDSHTTWTFSGLDPERLYNFKGTCVRGGGYADRWTLAEINGALSYTNDHSKVSPTNVLTATIVTDGSLAANQAAFNSGINSTAQTGDYIGWGAIRPAVDGTFSIRCKKYIGTVPNGSSSPTDDAKKGYHFVGIRLEEIVSTGPARVVLQPTNQTVVLGDPFSIVVGAGGSTPIFYFWYKNNTLIANETNYTFSVASAALTNGGNYYAVVSNSLGRATSAVAVITIISGFPIVITAQPQSQSVPLGQRATFSVTITNNATRPRFQWYSNMIAVANATNATLVVSNVSISAHLASFRVAITNIANAVTSNPAILTVLTNRQVLFVARTNLNASDLVISNLLAAQNFIVIVQDDRTSAATQTNYKALVVISSTVDSGQVGSKFNLVSTPVIVWESAVYSAMLLTAGTATNYQGTVTNQQHLRIYDPLHPLAAGLSNTNLVFTRPQTMNYGVPGANAWVVATATNGDYLPVIFAYEKGALLANPILTANARRVGFFLGDNGGTNLTAAASNLFNTAVQWAISTGSTNSPVGITRQPAHVSVPEGLSATFSVIVTGTPPYYFQWQKNGTNIVGATGRIYTTPATVTNDNGSTFRVVVTNKIGTSVTSSLAILTVTPPLCVGITNEPRDLAVGIGQSASFSMSVTGTVPRIQWFKSNAPPTLLLNATNLTYSISSCSLSDAGYYYATVSNRVCFDISRYAQLVVMPPITNLLQMTNAWRYVTNATDQPGFMNLSFDDSTWLLSNGVFSVPADDVPAGTPVGTVLPLNLPGRTDDAIRTFYFRTHFNFNEDPGAVSIIISNLIDDGVIFYLNGQELTPRIRMPAGTITYSNLASGSVGDATWASFEVSPYLLNQGSNLLAAEVHQVTTNSSDLVFGCIVHMAYITPTPLAVTAQPQDTSIEEVKSGTLNVSVSGGAPHFFWYKGEDYIVGANRNFLRITNASSADEGFYHVVVSNAFSYIRSRDAYVTILIDTNPPTLVWADGTIATTNVYVSFSEPIQLIDATNKANYVISNVTAGTRLTINSAVFTNGTNVILNTAARSPAANYILIVNNIRDVAPLQNMILPNSKIPISQLMTLSTWENAVWNYYDPYYYPGCLFCDATNLCLGTAWREPGYDSGGLPAWWGDNVGLPGIFWLGRIELPVQLGSQLSATMARTAYFRHHLNFTGNPSQAKLQLQHVVDSGAVFFLNGVEIARFNMGSNLVDCTSSSASSLEPSFSGWLDVRGDSIRYGDNVLAVELHQRNAGGDTNRAFGCQLRGQIQSLASGPVIICTGPRDVRVMEGQPVTFDLTVVGAAYFQWYENGVAIPGATNATYTIPAAPLSLNDASYYVVARNGTSSATSGSASLTVYADNVPPGIVSAVATSTNTVLLTFTEPLGASCAGNPSHYTFSGGPGPQPYVTSAVLTNGTNVILTVLGRFDASNMVTALVCDASAAANPAVTNTASLGMFVSVPIDSSWKYYNVGDDLGTEWINPVYPETGWSGPAPAIFYTKNDVVAPRNTFLNTNSPVTGQYVVTFYFRMPWVIPFAASNATIGIRHVIDDGAIFYMNGTNFYRFNMNAPPQGYTNLATATVSAGVYLGPFTTNVSVLRSNLVAVELHQVNLSSSDVAFGAEMSLTVSSSALPPPSCNTNTQLNVAIISPTLARLSWLGKGFELQRATNFAKPPATTAWTVLTTGNNDGLNTYNDTLVTNSFRFYRLHCIY